MKKVFVVGVFGVLCSCAPAAGVGGGIGSAIVVPMVASSLGVSTATVDAVAKAACATQEAANAATAIAVERGSAAWADRFSHVSKLAGVGCVW